MSGRKTADSDIISGYNEGADEYLLKPLSFPVLVAIINAVLRRYSAGAQDNSDRVSRLGMVIDPAARTVHADGRPVPLIRATARERNKPRPPGPAAFSKPFRFWYHSGAAFFARFPGEKGRL